MQFIGALLMAGPTLWMGFACSLSGAIRSDTTMAVRCAAAIYFTLLGIAEISLLTWIDPSGIASIVHVH